MKINKINIQPFMVILDYLVTKFSTYIPPMVVIFAANRTGKISNSISLARYLKNKTSIVSMFEAEMINGIVPEYQLTPNINALVISEVLFPDHTSALIKIVSYMEQYFPMVKQIIFITTCSPKSIPFEAFRGKIGLLRIEEDYKQLKKEAKQNQEELLKLKRNFKVKGEKPKLEEIDGAKNKHAQLTDKAKNFYLQQAINHKVIEFIKKDQR